MHVDVPGHARAGSLADVHAEIYAVRSVELAENLFHFLGQIHHFVRSLDGKLLQLVKVGEGHNHYVTGRIGIRVQDDIAMLGAMDDSCLGIVSELGKITEDAAGNLFSGGDVSVAPGGPEIIHRRAE